MDLPGTQSGLNADNDVSPHALTIIIWYQYSYALMTASCNHSPPPLDLSRSLLPCSSLLVSNEQQEPYALVSQSLICLVLYKHLGTRSSTSVALCTLSDYLIRHHWATHWQQNWTRSSILKLAESSGLKDPWFPVQLHQSRLHHIISFLILSICFLILSICFLILNMFPNSQHQATWISWHSLSDLLA